MRHQKQGRKLSRRKEHRVSMLANLASSLILHGRVKTTDAKAKEVRPFVERMVTFARRGDLHARRIVLSRLRDSAAVKKLFDEIGPQYVNRFGGYTRIVKLGFRHGDNAPVSLIEFVSEDEPKKTTKRKNKPAAKAQSKKAAPKATETVTEAPDETATEPEAVAEAAVEEPAAASEAAPVEETAPAEEVAEAEEKPAEESGDTAEEPDGEKQ